MNKLEEGRTSKMSRKYSKEATMSMEYNSYRENGYPRTCDYCYGNVQFESPSEFAKHIRMLHTTQEGGSFLCRYGENGICQKLPLEGVCDIDFEAHIRRFHTTQECQQRDEDDALSLRTIRLTSETPTETYEQPKFSLLSFTQNLSAVLADPTRPRSETSTFFTRHWGESFIPNAPIPVSKNLPKITMDSFRKYNKTTGEAYKRYRSVRRELRLNHDGGGLTDGKQDADDLPTIFIDPRFSLSDPELFSAVFTIPQNEDQDALRQTVSGKNSVPATPVEVATTLKPGEFRDYESLQNRLEMMHDVVDGRLASKLVSKTDAFWQVVRSYSGLQEQLAVAMNSVKMVRSKLKMVDELVCDQSNKIVEVHNKHEQRRKLLTKLHDINCLREAQSTVQMMLSQGDYPKAIECIETSLDVLSKDLNGVTCFRHLSSQLRELYNVIGKMMIEDFATLIQKELGVKPDSGALIQAEGELSAVLLGLIQMKKYAFIGVLREEIIEGAKNIMRQVVKNQILSSGLNLNDFDPSLTQLGEPVRQMKHSQFVQTVGAAMQEQFEFCKRLEALQELMLEIAHRANPDGSENCNSILESLNEANIPDYDTDGSEGSDIMNKSASSGPGSSINSGSVSATTLMSIDIKSEGLLRKILPIIAEFGHQCSQQRISRLLIARAKNASLTESTTPTQLSEVLKMVNEYQIRCNGWYTTQNQKIGYLGRAVNKLSCDYIEKFHSSRKVRIGNLLDTEVWRATDVADIDQEIVRSAIETGVLRILKNIPESDKTEETSATIDSQNGNQYGKTININGESFVVVGSCITMIRILAEYCEAISEIPTFAPDWNSRVIEILKTFNSRCCQLILGAGALQLVGLKTISVRNLALASRSIELINRLVPLIRDEMDKVLPNDRKSLLRYFAQVEGEYKEHIHEIALKLIGVIDHYTTNCLGMWEVKGTVPSPEFQQICRHMTKFHNGLVGIMPTSQIQDLFMKVHDNFKANLKEHIIGIGVTPHDTLKFGYVTKDYMFYQQNMKMMESCRDLELESLNDILFDNQ